MKYTSKKKIFRQLKADGLVLSMSRKPIPESILRRLVDESDEQRGRVTSQLELHRRTRRNEQRSGKEIGILQVRDLFLFPNDILRFEMKQRRNEEPQNGDITGGGLDGRTRDEVENENEYMLTREGISPRNTKKQMERKKAKQDAK